MILMDIEVKHSLTNLNYIFLNLLMPLRRHSLAEWLGPAFGIQDFNIYLFFPLAPSWRNGCNHCKSQMDLDLQSPRIATFD